MRKSSTPNVAYVLKLRRKAARRKHRRARKMDKARRQHERFLLSLAEQSELPAVELAAPRHFGLLRAVSHGDVVPFLRRLVKLALVQNRIVCIDFRPTIKFYSDGTLLFYAELQRILQRRPGSVGCIPPIDPVARQVLSHLQLLRQMGRPKVVPSIRDDVTHWQVFSGVHADATQGVGEAIANLPDLPQNQLGKLFRSVSEALTNVTQHAYIAPRMDGTGNADDRGWWMFVRREPEELVVIFCDLGVGVPYTVPRLEKHAGWLAGRLGMAMRAMGVGSHQDGETIQVTVDEKRSRFEAEHRGNGFANIVETISAAGKGRLIIYSNRGAYTYSLLNGDEEHRAYNYAESIYGTLVAWHIVVPKVIS